MSNSIATVESSVFSPRKIDLSKRVYGDRFTADDLHYLRARDSRARYAIEVRVADAFRNGYSVVNPTSKTRAIIEENDKNVKKCSKWAVEFGWAIIIHMTSGDDETSRLAASMPEEAVSLATMAWHPFTQDLGGIERWDTDSITGLPTFFYIRVPKVASVFKISADRCDIYTWGDYSNHWMGLSDMSSAFDPVVGLRMWEGTAIRRQRDYATARYLVPMPPNCFDPMTGAPLPAVKAVADEVFVDVPYMLVPAGAGAVEHIGGPMDDNEETLTIESVKESIASGLAIAKTDMTGAVAGQKLGTDANESTYSMTMKDIQVQLLPYVKKTYARLGVDIAGFKNAAELSPQSKYATLAVLNGMFSMSPPTLRKPLARLLESFYEGEFGMEVKIDENEEPEPEVDESEEEEKPKKKKGWFKK